MKRSLFFASAIPAATVILWLAGRACYAPSQRHEEDESWPYALGKLRDVPKRYPSHEASTNAVEVARLAEGLDVDLGQETGRRPQPPRPSRARMLRSAMRKYIVGAVNTANDDVEAPPPEIAKFLEERADALAAVRAQLNANAPAALDQRPSGALRAAAAEHEWARRAHFDPGHRRARPPSPR